MNFFLNDIETSIETLQRMIKGNLTQKESIKIVLEELWVRHNYETNRNEKSTKNKKKLRRQNENRNSSMH